MLTSLAIPTPDRARFRSLIGATVGDVTLARLTDRDHRFERYAAWNDRGEACEVTTLAPLALGDLRARQSLAVHAEVARRASHPAVRPAYLVLEEGWPFLVRRHVEGVTLDRCLATRGRLSLEESLRLGMRLADALVALHDVDLAHLHVKPSAVIVSPDDVRRHGVWLDDFGGSAGRLRAAELPPVASPWSAPEVARGEVNQRSDQYGLAAVIFQCLAGLPYARPGKLAAMLAAFARGWGVGPSWSRDDLGIEVLALEGVLRRALAADPARRFRNMHALRAALRTCVAPALVVECAA